MAMPPKFQLPQFMPEIFRMPGTAPGAPIPPRPSFAGAPPGPAAPAPAAPSGSGLPPGTVVYEDGSMRFPAEFAQRFVNQTGGANPVTPPPLPSDLSAVPTAAPLLNADAAAASALTPPPPIPFRQGTMPGQPPAPPTDPAGKVMFDMQQRNAPPEAVRPPLSAPPNATPPPRDQWPSWLQNPGGESKPPTPMDRMKNRGTGSTTKKRGG